MSLDLTKTWERKRIDILLQSNQLNVIVVPSLF